jgi:hypothetical protein
MDLTLRKIFNKMLYEVDSVITNDNYYSVFYHGFCEFENNSLSYSSLFHTVNEFVDRRQ